MQRAVSGETAQRLFGGRPPARLALLRAAWTHAVGSELAWRTEVLALEGETLRVRVPDARWRKVLHRMQGELIRRLRDLAGGAAPRRLGFTEGGMGGPATDEAPVPVATLPLPAAPEAVDSASSAITDSELRRRFLDAAARYLARTRQP